MSDPQLFVVRVWRRLHGEFRASVRDVDADESQLFSAAGELARYLEQRADECAPLPRLPNDPALASAPDAATVPLFSPPRRSP